MPFLGWALGSQFAGYIQNIDHWVAFALLGIIGGHMIRDALAPEEEEVACAVAQRLDHKRLFLMAIATSIDALAIGVTFAFLDVNIVPQFLSLAVQHFACPCRSHCGELLWCQI